jgi:antitoxin MazE
MIKTLSKHGNAMALVIDKALLQFLRISKDTPLEIGPTEDGKGIVIKPLTAENRKAKIDEALNVVNEQYGTALKNLAK